MADPARFLRQILLPEIGEAGQERLGRSVARVGRDDATAARDGASAALAHEVAERYARGAGFARVEPGHVAIDALAPPDVVRDEAARAVLAGSRAALAALRDACGVVDPRDRSRA